MVFWAAAVRISTAWTCRTERFGTRLSGFAVVDRPSLSDTIDRFFADLEHGVDEVFDHLVDYYIGSTDVRATSTDQDPPKCDDPTVEEYYCGYSCTIVVDWVSIAYDTLTTRKDCVRKQRPTRRARTRRSAETITVETYIFLEPSGPANP